MNTREVKSEKKTVWTVGELMNAIEKGKLPYVDRLDRYKTIRNKLFREAEEKIFTEVNENE